MNRLELYLKVISLGFTPNRYLTVENHESALIDDNYYYLYLCEVQKWLRENNTIIIESIVGDNTNPTGLKWQPVINDTLYAKFFDKYEFALEEAIKIYINTDY